MLKLARFIVDKRKAFYLIFLASFLFCAVSISKVRINDDITTYLPSYTETRRGLTLMEEEFITLGSANIMVSNITYDAAYNLSLKIEKIPGVSSVEFDDTQDHYHDSAALFTVSFDGEEDDPDTAAALLAGFAILPAVFAFGIAPESGPPLMFITLPRVFQQMPGGRIFALLFFVSVFFAGITSLMNMLEACGEALTSTFRLSRTVSTLLVGAAAFLPGLFLESLAGMGGWMDLITIYVSPFGALLVAVCIYFVLGMKDIRAELALGRARAPGRLFGITARFYVFLTVAVWILGIAYGGIG